MDMEVFDCGKQVGTLRLEKMGLYQAVSCACRPESSGILRLFVWKGDEGACLGVLCPEGMDFTLRRHVSKAGLPFAPETAVVGCEDDGFWPWRGEFDGAWIDDGYLRKTEAGPTLAVPQQTDRQFFFAHAMEPAETRVICGRDCVVLRPVQPKPEPTPEPEPEPIPEPEPEPIPEPIPEPEEEPEQTHEPMREESKTDIPQTRFHTEM